MFIQQILLTALLIGLPSPAPADNYCDDAAQWQKWEQLATKYPDDDSIAAGYALRIGLCEQIKNGSIENQRAIEIFERFFTALKESTREQERQQQLEVNDAGSQI